MDCNLTNIFLSFLPDIYKSAKEKQSCELHCISTFSFTSSHTAEPWHSYFIDDEPHESHESERSLRLYHGGKRRVQAGLRLAVVCIAVLVAAAVIDEADL